MILFFISACTSIAESEREGMPDQVKKPSCRRLFFGVTTEEFQSDRIESATGGEVRHRQIDKGDQPSGQSPSLSLPWQKLLLTVLVSLVEFVNAAGGVNELDFACVEWVRCVGDLDLYNRILNSVNHEGLFGLGA